MKKFSKRKGLQFLATALLATLVFTGCGSKSGSKDSAEANANKEKKKLVIYTARDKNVVEYVVPKFEAKYPEYEVQVNTMGAQQILERVRGEKENAQADFWWGGTQASFELASKEGLLSPYKPSFADKIPALYKDKEDRWYGEILLPEVIMYNTEALKAEDLPKDWDDLLDAKYKNKIIIRGVLPSGTMRTIYSSLIYKQDPKDPTKGYEWLKKLDANTKLYAQDPTALYLKLARQEGTISLWNLQDIMIQKEQHNQPFGYIVPESGIPILVDAVGIVKGTKNEEGAKKFYEFLFEESIKLELAEKMYQIPVQTGIEKDKLPSWLKSVELKPMTIDWQVIAQNEQEWMKHWDANIKGQFNK